MPAISSNSTSESFDVSLFAQSAKYYAPPANLAPTAPRPLPRYPWTEVFGIDFSAVTMAQTLDYIDALIQRKTPGYLVTANLNYTMLCHDNPRLTEFTRRSELVLCDGMPILWRSRLNKQPLPERVAGADLIFKLAERAALKDHRIFMMGGAEGVAQKAADNLRAAYPRLKIVGTECPPFRQPTVQEHHDLHQRIRDARPDILLVAFGQPKGEYWIEDNYQELGVPVSIQLGASFDFVAGIAKRAPIKWQSLGLEWLYRTIHDPKRLLPRYARNAWYLLQAVRKDLLNATK